MIRKRFGAIAFAIAACTAAALTVVACKQGQGDRCQIDADCEEPLQCVQATQTCQGSADETIDATLPVDALDAPLADAADDAPLDGRDM